MRKRMDLVFWSSVLLIILFGTIGGVLYKSGTNALGTITFSRLLELSLTSSTAIYAALAAIGVLLFLYGGSNLRDKSFAAEYLFSPIIFLALVMLFISRLLIGVPLSVTGLGRLTALLTAFTVVSTALASALIFHEAYSPRVILGIALGIAAVLLIGEA